MKKSLLVLSLLIFLLSGCYYSSMVCDFAKPVLGIFTDHQLIVTDIDTYAMAEVRENVQIGDKLLSVRPAARTPNISPEPVSFTNRDIVSNLIGWYTIPPTCYRNGQILPLILQVERDGQIVDIDITWGNNTSQDDTLRPTATPRGTWLLVSPLNSPKPTPTPTPAPTPTPVPRDWLYF